MDAPSSSLSRVQLDKFYFDAVTEDGTGWIGYAARLAGIGPTATLASTLSWTPDPTVAVTHRRTLRGTWPTVTAESVAWSCPALAFAATWQNPQPAPADQVLWSAAGNGSVRWHPVATHGRVEVKTADRRLEGWGYVERLRINVAPWRLPISGLHWGRYASARHSVIWIEWEHAQPRHWLWHQGVRVEQSHRSDLGLFWPGHRLLLHSERARTLRAGQLGRTVFARWPAVARWMPARLQRVEEWKACTPATVFDRDGAEDRGWVIHEYVRFG